MTSTQLARSRPESWVGLLALVVVTCTAVILASQVIGVLTELPESVLGYDFRAFVTAGDLVDSGRSGDVYDIDAQLAAQGARFEEIDSEQGFLVFANPPFILPLLALIAPLSTTETFVALFAAATAALGLSAWLIARLVSPGTRRVLLSLGLLAGFPATYIALVQGQFSGLLLAGVLGAWWDDENNHPWRAGAWLAVLALKPHLLLLPLVVMLTGRRWRMLGGLSAAGGTLVVVGTAAVGLSGWREWLNLGSELASAGNKWGIKPRGMYSMRSLLHFVGGTDDFSDVRTLWLVGVGLAVVAAVVLAHRTNGLRTRREWGWGSLTLLMLLSSPHVSVNDLLIVLVAAVALVRLVPQRQRALPIAGLGLAALWTLAGGPLLTNVAPPVTAVFGMCGALLSLWAVDNWVQPRVASVPRDAMPRLVNYSRATADPAFGSRAERTS